MISMSPLAAGVFISKKIKPLLFAGLTQPRIKTGPEHSVGMVGAKNEAPMRTPV